MKVSLAWLEEFLKITVSAEELAKVMTLAGLEVEGIEKVGEDIVFDVSLTPNLGHCMSVVGIAREVAALLKIPVNIPDLELKEEGPAVEELISVEMKDAKNCPRYTCRVVEGIKVGPSPDWLQEKLEKVGVRSVNNIVDVTNFVMLGLGQPMHAFDLDKIEEKKVVVSSKRGHETLVTLDEKERDLPKEALLICDAKQPIAVAGVMGGLDSAVSENTTRILLESAYFHPAIVRKMSKWLSLRTDSSVRFEKGIDPQGVPLALDQAAAIIQKVAGGTVAKGRIDTAKKAFSPIELTVRTARANEILGTKLSLNEIISFFERLHFEIVNEENDAVTVKVPTYRNDIQVEIDLIEEIARIYGFNNIPMRPERYMTATIPDAPIYLFENEVRTLLLQEGMQEWITCDLISPEIAALTHEKKGEFIAVLKPASIDQSILRPSLLPSMLLSVKTNLDHKNHDLFSFEVGRTHFKSKEVVIEHSCVGMLLMGKRAPYHFDLKPGDVDFFDLKGICENLLESLFVINPVFEVEHSPHFHPKQQAHIVVGGKMVGAIGQIHPALLKKADIERPVFFAQLDLHSLFTCKRGKVAFRGLSLYPASERDWTLTVKKEVSVGQLLQAIKGVDAPFLEKITLLDLYKSDQIGKDRKNVTFRLVYRDPSKTIAMEAIEKEHAKITEQVARQFTF